MTPDEPTWDDTEFEAGANDERGFLSSESSGRKRITPDEPPIAPPPTPRKKEKARGPLFWFGVLAGVVMILAVVGGFFYWMAQPSVEEQAFMAAPSAQAPAVVDAASVPEPASDVDATADEVVHDPEALELLFGDDTTTASAQSPKPTATETAKATATPKATASSTSSTPSTSSTAESTKPSTPASRSTPPAKPTAPPVKTTQPKTSQSALYVVQVFSSPSRADADERLQLLRSKNVEDGYITEQQIKGETWYRVRYGSFTTRQAAEAEALRMGFKQPWIARIR